MRTLLAVAVLSAFAAAHAQNAADAPPWKQGISPDQAASTLHPFAPNMTGRAAKELPVDKLKAFSTAGSFIGDMSFSGW